MEGQDGVRTREIGSDRGYTCILMFKKLIVQELFGHVIWKDNSSVKMLSS